ncbi:putative endoplasmic reticulum-based factor for assembly of V-ATPase [Lyophyllum shimeji]|uniref:Endoplasmic reticulum-based factor for assembly of V-ATPase n=1 Tax=Lyophyllum shimeji TaxID=47721 RepID=A0A9P3UQJ3_LYOSH|nr:putative endoplasmic reticulum-based factor for assembly of V-ATPase [Lyophyllum shimeji]
MGQTEPSEDLKISLESHLLDTLRPLEAIIPSDLAKTLSSYTCSSPPPTIPYSVLQSVSQWARTTGLDALHSQSPPLDPHAYSMISLLAGTTTSPERKFGAYVPPKGLDEMEAAKAAERKSITALLNALLSIFGCAFAVWWAADRLGWKNEWRVLLALFVAIVIAVTEAILYLLWQSRRSSSTSKRVKSRRKVDPSRHKKDEGPADINPGEKSESITTSVDETTDAGLRRRQ